MILKQFISTYIKEENEISESYIEGNDLKMVVRMDVNIGYIANGFRPEFGYEVKHLFIFKNVIKENKSAKIKNVSFDSQMMFVTFEDENTLKIEDCVIEVINNIDK